MPSPSRTYLLVVVLIAGLLLTSTVAGYYALRYSQAQNNANAYLKELQQASSSKELVLTTNVLIDFGNGTQRWYNGTEVQPGWNVYLATLVVTNGNLNDTWDPAYGEHFVNGMFGVQNTQTESWFLWTYNSTSLWQPAQTGPDPLPASNGSIYAWSFCGISPSYGPTCPEP